MNEEEMGSEETSETGTGTKTRSGKYLTFVLGSEEYGLEILKVREIMGVIAITTIPNVPNFMKGVINLRGSVIPIIDLRIKFGMELRDYDKETCIIVVNMQESHIGIVVDTVSEVLDIAESDIDDAPALGTSINTQFILGIGKVKDKVVLLLNIDKVLLSEQMAVIHSATSIAS